MGVKQFFSRYWMCIFAFCFPLLIATTKIYTGAIPFWYDIARDFLLASQNLIKPTLIGPPSGIPGIFYGPYWVWYLSIGLLISKDPRVVSFLLATVPYFTIFPLLLLSFKRVFDTKILLILWLLFSIGAAQYATNLWNPNLAPLLILSLISLFTFSSFSSLDIKHIFLLLLGGFLSGLLINIHISFGIGVMISLAAFLFINSIVTVQKPIISKIVFTCLIVGLFFLGVGVAFIPTFAFEYRHGFGQTQAALHTIANATLYNSAVVGQRGLTQTGIIENFFGKLSSLFQVPVFLAFLGYGILAGYVICLKKYNLYHVVFTSLEKRLFTLLLCITTGILFLYLSSKNPVWDYHFIGVEVLLLLFLGIVLQKSQFFLKWMQYFMGFFLLLAVVNYTHSAAENPPAIRSSYAAVNWVADFVYNDAKGKPFVYAAHSPAIYTFDYDYAFAMLDTKKAILPLDKKDDASYVYVIVPKTTREDREGYRDFITPPELYFTSTEWQAPDETHIYKRERVKN